jgi:hypothetical protein
MKINNIFLKRESLTLPINGNDETWDYLTMYDENNNIIKRSNHVHPETDVFLEYEGLEFGASPSALKNGEDNIFITVSSLKKFINK